MLSADATTESLAFVGFGLMQRCAGRQAAVHVQVLAMC